MKSLPFYFTTLIILTAILFSCHNDQNDTATERPTVILKKNKPTSDSDSTVKSAPIINISDTISFPMHIISIKDSASDNVRLSKKLSIIYGEKLQNCIKKNKLTISGPPMAWYKTQKAPFFFEAGFPVNKKPSKLTQSVRYKHLNSFKIIVAHYFGPYEESVQAYQYLKDWMKENKKSISSQPYEIYVDDPIGKDGKPLDPYKVQTDIVFPYH